MLDLKNESIHTIIGYISRHQSQELIFKVRTLPRGKNVSMIFSTGVIESPDIEMFFNYDELTGLLSFLLGDQKKVVINIESLIHKLVVDGNATTVDEVKKQVTEALIQAVKDANN